MSVISVEIDLGKITDNARQTVALCQPLGIEVLGVTKGVCGCPAVARAILAGGVTRLGDSRLDNLERLRDAGIRAPLTLLRSPALSEVGPCVALADASVHGSLEVLRAVNAAAEQAGRRHRVLLMVDIETGREGFSLTELAGVCRVVADLPALSLRGLGVYFPRLQDAGTYAVQLERFVAEARRIESEHGIPLPVLSGGSTNVFGALTLAGRQVAGVNQLRIGTALLLGLVSSVGPQRIPGFHHDTVVFSAELIEVKRRDRLVGILACGHLDTDPAYLFPVTPGIRLLNVTSDHAQVDLTDAAVPPRVGDRLSFHLGYFAMARLLASRYVRLETRS